MQIRPFELSDFELLRSWVTDADLLLQFAGSGWQYPLEKEAIAAYREQHPGRCLYLGYDDAGLPVAIGEIITGDHHSPRIGRVLVGPAAQRGQGLGKRFISALVAEYRKSGTEPIHLFVLENNARAIRCYEQLGFRFTGDAPLMTLRYRDEDVPVLKMTLATNDQ